MIWITSAHAPMCLHGLHTSIKDAFTEGKFILTQSLKSGITQTVKLAHTEHCCKMNNYAEAESNGWNISFHFSTNKVTFNRV